MITCGHFYNIIKLSNEGRVTFVDFVASSKLSILIIAHAIDFAFFCQQQGVEDTAGNLMDWYMETYRQGS